MTNEEKQKLQDAFAIVEVTMKQAPVAYAKHQDALSALKFIFDFVNSQVNPPVPQDVPPVEDEVDL